MLFMLICYYCYYYYLYEETRTDNPRDKYKSSTIVSTVQMYILVKECNNGI